MYHGIVAGYFPVTAIDRKERLYHLEIELKEGLISGLARGASISVDGVCLTVSTMDGTKVSFDVMGESLDCTTLKFLDVGDFVNIERSARSGDEIGGHLLSGHVDGLAQIIRIQTPPNNYILTCTVANNLSQYIFRKGYVGLNGASLTVADVDRKNNWFSVHLIPETLRLTTFEMKHVGDFLNIEIERNTQVLVDTVRELFEKAISNISEGQEKALTDSLSCLLQTANEPAW